MPNEPRFVSPKLIAAVIAAGTGVVSFYYKVTKTALEHLGRQGAFEDAQKERKEALGQLPDARKNGAFVVFPGEDHGDAGKSTYGDGIKYLDGNAVADINQRYRERKRDIIRRFGADKVGGAWKILSPHERTHVLGFSAVNSIVAGALTYSIARVISTPGKGVELERTGGGSGYSCSSSGGWFGCGGGHHGGGGHGHGGGHGCGLGCGGFGCGGGH